MNTSVNIPLWFRIQRPYKALCTAVALRAKKDAERDRFPRPDINWPALEQWARDSIIPPARLKRELEAEGVEVENGPDELKRLQSQDPHPADE